ncbi:MAG: enoyl-CoA hydratase/isomerase family protein [Saprospiraceae bacterium]|nr:enoyl-CoA hydratase/isomerase family protein [Pyrinomonadaceae bacterium]
MSNSIITEDRGNALVLRFVRPEIRNPLSVAVLDELHGMVDSLGNKPVIFTGQGNVFASGANLNEIAGITAENAKEFACYGQDLMAMIAGLEQTTIAAINGYCFGGALDLALACERRIASVIATFSHPGAGLGFITGWGGTQRLPRLIGQAKALEMFFTTRPVTAAEALRIGLIDEIADDIMAVSLANISGGCSS